MLTFLFTDIEGSTKKWEKFKDKMAEALKKHDVILKECINEYNGEIVKHTGDGVFAVFKKKNPLECAVEIQKRFFKENWESVGGLRIRIAIHAGIAEKRGNDYYGTDVNRTARVLQAGWGGQILLTEEIVKNSTLPENAEIIDLGTHKLKDLSEPKKIYQLIHSDLPLKKFPPLNSLSCHPNNLPIQTTPFIGRKKEVSEIVKILKSPECRILTLTGSGGIGKTRLAIQAGAEIIENFPDGVFFVPLELLDSKELIVNKIADSIGFNFYSREEPVIQLINYLKEKEMLLIMDNFEHIIEGAEIVSQVLRNTGKIKFFITSREVLKIHGEWIYELKGLDFPGDRKKFQEYSGIQIFINGAKRIKPDFVPSDEDKEYIAKICQIVQGLPLAIEIASAWVKMLSCKEIAEEIQKNMDFLSSSLMDIPDRHRSLRAVFDYSWKLLNEDEKRAISCLSVFKGGWTKESAKEVAGVNLVLLLSLINKSLVKKENSRYNMLDLTMKYAEERLKENPEEYKSIKQKHTSYYADFIDEKKMYMRKPEQKEKFEKPVLEEIENIREAWKYAIESRLIEEIDRFIEPLHFFYNEKARYQEGRLFFEMAENCLCDLKNEKGVVLYSKILARLGSFYSSMGFYREAERCLEKALKVFKKFNLEKETAMVYSEFGGISFYLQDYKKAEVFFKKALEIAEKLDEKYNISGFINNIGVVYLQTGKYDSAKDLFEKSLEISKELNYKKGIAIGFGNLGLIFHHKGDYKKAEEFLKKSLEIEIELENKLGVANTCHNLGLNYKYMGNYEKAREYYEKALAIRKEIGDRMGITISLNNLANLSLEKGNYDDAETFSRRCLELNVELGNAVGETGALCILGKTLIVKKEPDKAVKYIYDALKKALELNVEIYIKYGIFDSADFFIMKKNYETALKILIYLKENYKEEFEKKVEKKLADLKLDSKVLEKVSAEISGKNLMDFAKEIVEEINSYLKHSF